MSQNKIAQINKLPQNSGLKTRLVLQRKNARGQIVGPQNKQTPAQKPTVDLGIDSSINALKGSGHPLPDSVREFFEPRFVGDFTRVRVHTNERAATTVNALDARAFTVGHDVAFAAGQYSPGTTQGRELLGHELTHVMQQQEGRVKPTFQTGGLPINDEIGLESEADRMGKIFSRGNLSHPTPNLNSSPETLSSSPSSLQKKGDVAQFALPAIIAGLTAAEWIAIGALGYVMGQSAVAVPSGDVNYTFDEMEGTLLPGGGTDVPAYRTAHPSAQTSRATHHLAVWFGTEGSRKMGIKMGITFLYDQHAMGSVSIGILDTYDWPACGGNVIINFTPEALASGDRAQIRITANLSTTNFLGMNDTSGNAMFTLRADGDLSLTSTSMVWHEIG
jgi:hypothetical protein